MATVLSMMLTPEASGWCIPCPLRESEQSQGVKTQIDALFTNCMNKCAGFLKDKAMLPKLFLPEQLISAS